MSATDARSTEGPTQDLRARIRARRREIHAYLIRARRRTTLLIRTAIIAGALATALTAAPALGGESLANWLDETFGLGAPSWQILCGIAAACSLASTIATQLRKSDDDGERIVRAQGAAAVLEELDIGLEAGGLDPDAATERYIECVRNTAFIAGTNAS
jgi:hypothetical protein